MADRQYATALGFVQFDVDERDVNGQVVRDVTIRTPGTAPDGGKLLRVTLWPEFAAESVEKGDFIAVDGTVDVRQVGDKTYVNMNASSLAIIEAAEKLNREVVSRKPAKKTSF